MPDIHEVQQVLFEYIAAVCPRAWPHHVERERALAWPMNMTEKLSRAFPALGTYKRFAVAARDSIRRKSTYAQHGEDLRALELLHDFDLSDGLYVDVGANHPTDISNTYMFYRRGLKGIVIEPNPELAHLFSVFRPRDITLPIACSETSGVATFVISKTPVLSSLDEGSAGAIWKKIRVPLLPLDAIIRDLAPAWIPLLSVDVEGHAGAVLRGASNTLRRTYLVCVEAADGTEEERQVLGALAQADYRVVERVGCNLLAINQRVEDFERYRTPDVQA